MIAPSSMLTLAEAASELGVSIPTVWRLIRDGKLRATQYPGVRRTLIHRPDLDRFRERSKTTLKGAA